MMQLLKSSIWKHGSLDITITESLYHAQTVLISNQETLEFVVDQRRKTYFYINSGY
mgnify:FL=1